MSTLNLPKYLISWTYSNTLVILLGIRALYQVLLFRNLSRLTIILKFLQAPCTISLLSYDASQASIITLLLPSCCKRSFEKQITTGSVWYYIYDSYLCMYKSRILGQDIEQCRLCITNIYHSTSYIESSTSNEYYLMPMRVLIIGLQTKAT
jgi:hypothetical protein